MSSESPEIEDAEDVPVVSPLEGKRVAFVGKLGGVNKREAQQLVRQHGGLPLEKVSVDVDLIVIGADELPLHDLRLNDGENFLNDEIREAAAQGRLELIAETQLWQRLGLVEGEQNIRRLYTPAMLADLLSVSVATIRRWHRRGLIIPVREVHRLPYFDFQEVATARRLAELVTAGASPGVIEKQLAELSRFVPEVERPLAQLSIIVEGQQLLLRQGEGLVEPGGQMRIDFDSLEATPHENANSELGSQPAILSLVGEPTATSKTADIPTTPSEMLQHAAACEDAGRLDLAIEFYRAALAAAGPKPEICFQLAELLYRVGDISAARERYYMAIEMDEDYVEARANLGCILAETGQLELAVAAFTGALRFHPDYPDVHYHLARAMDELGNNSDATQHWQAFLGLAPDSPWADEARIRLGELTS